MVFVKKYNIHLLLCYVETEKVLKTISIIKYQRRSSSDLENRTLSKFVILSVVTDKIA